ncbi:MAG: site-specific DNA-methyltransferase [Lachnospiraceae bacterium]|nr:site-specific DNA-methyltransferase [Lachnospiraceae bacterium]
MGGLERRAEEPKERYQFTWPGKSRAARLADAPVFAALRPCREESVDFDNTGNLYIEGDNLEVLKLLQETYLGKVHLIYIDPPYNTGRDFVYRDKFAESEEAYLADSGQRDEEGNRLFQNTESNGRFHTNWLNMMYPRLKLARTLLSEDGAIYISIDETEHANLQKVCEEIFGGNNFVADIVWKRKRGRDNSARQFSRSHEYCLVYAKDKSRYETGYLKLDEKTRKAYKNPDRDPRGDYRMLGCWARGTQGGVKYAFTTKDGHYFPERLWLFSEESLRALDEEDKLVVRGDNLYRKMFLYENKGKIPETLWEDASNAANASDEIKKLFGEIIFDTPKPTPYIKRMLEISTRKDSLILDFFSGSATTANAVMAQNAEDGGERKYILVQIPETVPADSPAAKAGYANICEIGKERIRRAAAEMRRQIRDAGLGEVTTDSGMDLGFRVLKLDSPNEKDVCICPSELEQASLPGLVDHIKEDRTPEDLLFQAMLELGIPLSARIRETGEAGERVFDVEEGFLAACLDSGVSEETVRAAARKKPVYAVFRDGSMTDDQMAGLERIFAAYSPKTVRKVL